MIKVILSFDTEDFVTPQSDDAAGVLAGIMSKHGVRGCFCMVGDKMRALVRRGRHDVLAKLRDHEIDYHTNTHGFWPTTALFLDELDWDRGVERLTATELPGLTLVEDTFGQRPIAYAKTDTHWAAQQIDTFSALGMKVFASSPYEMAPGKPIWYANSLNIRYHISFERQFTQPDPLRTILAEFDAACEARNGDGYVLVGTHPCMWVCQTFYDTFNVKVRGALPAREKWRVPPLRPPAESRRLYRDLFGGFLRYLCGRSDVAVVTYRDLYAEFERPATEWVTVARAARLAQALIERFSYVKQRGRYYSPAEVSGVLSYLLSSYAKDGVLPRKAPVRHIIGPVEAQSDLSEEVSASARDLLAIASQAEEVAGQTRRVDSRFRVGARKLPASAALKGMAQLLVRLADGASMARRVRIGPTPALPELAHTVFKDVPLGANSIPEEFVGERVKEAAKLQTWTAKPAE